MPTGNSATGTGGGTGAATFAQGFIDNRYLLLIIKRYCSIGTERNTGLASGTEFLFDNCGSCLNLDFAFAYHGHDSGSGC